MVRINVNGRSHQLEVEPKMPLLWALRDVLGMTGTKFGCGVAQGGACTVHVEGEPVRSCVMPVSAVAGKRITTIEGFSRDSSHAVQKAWLTLERPQRAKTRSNSAVRESKPRPTDDRHAASRRQRAFGAAQGQHR